jgi:hypothetical protein
MHVERVHPAESGLLPDYAGFVHLVPVRAPTGDTVGSLEIGAPALRRKSVVEGADGKRISTLFEEWLGEALKHKPTGWKGFAVGDGQVPGAMTTGEFTNPAIRTNTIAQNAEILGQYISNVRKQTGADMVDLVVHSMGGMISRYYIDRVMQERLFQTFTGALVPGGYLVLGKVETLFGGARERLILVDPRERLYRRPA